MKKLRFFALLAATALLAFALVLSCGSPTGPTDPGVVEPPEGGQVVTPPSGSGPSYPNVPGTVDPPINPPPPLTAPSIKIDQPSITIEKGTTLVLTATPSLPEGWDYEKITWKVEVGGSATTKAVVTPEGESTTLIAVDESAVGVPLEAVVTATLFNITKADKTAYTPPLPATAVTDEIMVTIFNSGSIENMTAANIQKLSWEIIEEKILGWTNEDPAKVTALRAQLKTAVVDKINALQRDELAAALAGDQTMMSSEVGTPAWSGNVTPNDNTSFALSFYAVMNGKTEFPVNLLPGWKFADANGNAKDGNVITVTGTDIATQKLVYEIPGITVAANKAITTIRVVPCTEVTFSVASNLVDIMTADTLITTPATDIVTTILTWSNSGTATTNFKLGGSIVSSGLVDTLPVAGSGATKTRTVLIRAGYANTKIQVPANIYTKMPPYSLALSPGSLPAAILADSTTYEYPVGALDSKSYTLTLAKQNTVIEKIEIAAGASNPLAIPSHTASLATNGTGLSITPTTVTKDSITWHTVAAPTSKTNMATTSATAGGTKVYARIVLDVAPGNVLKTGFAKGDVTVPNNGATPPVDICTVESFDPGTEANGEKDQYVLILAFEVAKAQIAAATITLGTVPVAGAPVPKTAAITHTATAVGSFTNGLLATVDVTWQLKRGGTTSAYTDAATQEDDQLIATIKLSPVLGFKFDGSTGKFDTTTNALGCITALDAYVPAVTTGTPAPASGWEKISATLPDTATGIVTVTLQSAPIVQ